MSDLTELLRPHVANIKADAKKGNKAAKEVIKFYEMHRLCPGDPGASTFCQIAFAAWKGGGE